MPELIEGEVPGTAARALSAQDAEALAGLARAALRLIAGAEAPPASTSFVEAPSEAVEEGAYSGLGLDEFMAAIAREAEPPEDDIPLPPSMRDLAEAPGRVPTSEEALNRIGPRGYRFIVAHEVSSRQTYEQRLKNPILPGASSGITIGIGYDIGHVDLATFRRHWGDLIPAADLSRLEACVGLTQSAAAAKLAGVRDIEIPFETATKVFERASLPETLGRLLRAVGEAAVAPLPALGVAALVSLTFNRGASFQRSGDRYREMREIPAALIAGEPGRVPGLLRAMKRIWQGQPNVRGLFRRRDEEADLFAEGLAEEVPVAAALGIAATAAEGSGSAAGGYDPTPDLDERSEFTPGEVIAEAPARRLSASDVAWPTAFGENPDYVHLPASAEAATVALDAGLIERAIALGFYQPVLSHGGHLIVAVRGAAMPSPPTAGSFVASVDLREQKPDHRAYRCVIVVYHRAGATLAPFRASTTPNRGGVAGGANFLNGLGGTLANMLPTGCYRLCVGTHFGSVTVPTLLRLGTGPGPDTALEVTTLRTRNDGAYRTDDLWDRSRPADNIHPGFGASSADFSSLGCLTVPGGFDGLAHRGDWAAFRRAGAFDSARHEGKRYDLLLTTGMELAAIAREDGAAPGLRRLAHGSSGPVVERLQQRLGATVDGVFGPRLKKALVGRETAATGRATGLWTMAIEQALGISVFDA